MSYPPRQPPPPPNQGFPPPRPSPQNPPNYTVGARPAGQPPLGGHPPQANYGFHSRPVSWPQPNQHRAANPYAAQQQPWAPPTGAPNAPYRQPPSYGQRPGFMPPGGPYQPPVFQQPPRNSGPPLPLILLLGLAGFVLLIMVGALLRQGATGDADYDRPPLPDSSEYQNQDYEVPSASSPVPDLPIPDSYSEAELWLTDNAIYGQELASPVECTVGPLDDASAMSDAQLEARFNEYVKCLTRVWGPSLEQAGYAAYLPSVTVYPAGGEVVTACGTQSSNNAFYCGADQQLYLATDILNLLPAAEASHPVTLDFVIAHEYGHAIQGRTGISPALYTLAESIPENERLDLNRRLETQADCFAGLAANSLSASMGWGAQDHEMVKDIAFAIGDDQLSERFELEGNNDHGRGENRRLWVGRGLESLLVNTCNTFVAPSEEVD